MKVRNPFLTRLAARLFVFVCRSIFRSLRIDRHHEGPPGTLPEQCVTPRFIICIWHDCVILPLFGGKVNRLAVLTSRHADGGFVAEVLARLKIPTIRGSTTRGGAQALREMLKVSDQTHLAITPDGPRGPRRRMTPGAIYLASRSGCPILPTGFAWSDCWRIPGKWTDLVIPKPFSRAVLVSGPPIVVPAELARDTLDQYVHRVQAEMERLELAARRKAEGGRMKAEGGRRKDEG